MSYGYAPTALLPPIQAAPILPSSNIDAVMREQLDYLLDHVSTCGSGCFPHPGNCSVCQHYDRVRFVLLDMFTALTPARVAGCGAG